MFFEYQLTNPYSHEERFTIEVKDPELNVVADSNVWQYYRDVLEPAAGCLSGQVEHEMIPKVSGGGKQQVVWPEGGPLWYCGTVTLSHCCTVTLLHCHSIRAIDK